MSSVSDTYQSNSSSVNGTDEAQNTSLSDQFATQAQTESKSAPSSWDDYSQQDNDTAKSFYQASKSFAQGMGTDNAQLVRQGADGSAYIDHGSASTGSYAPQRAHDAFSAGASEDEDDGQVGGNAQSYAADQSGQGSGSLSVQFEPS